MGSVFRWTGQASTNFATAANWYDMTTGALSSVAPGVNDEAFVSTTGSITGNGTVYQLVLSGVGVAGGFQGNLVSLGGGVTILPNALLQAGDLLAIGEQVGPETNVNLDGGSEIDVVPVDANASGVLVAGSGESATLSLVEQGGRGSRLLSYGDGGSTVLTVGSAGYGVIDISGSASALGGFGTSLIGTGIDGTGTVAANDGGRVVLGADAISGGLTLGAGGAMGFLSLAGASEGLLQGQVVVGASGASGLSGIGSVSVTGGSGLVVRSSHGAGMVLGELKGSSGTLLISDTYSFANVSGGLEVGRFGTGTLTVQNQSRVASGTTASPTTPALSIGVDSGGSGTVSVLSHSEFLALGAGIAVGGFGSGGLSVTGGTVTVTTAPLAGVSALDAGVSAGSRGVVRVGGGGVVLDTQSAGMIIGDSGSGTMAIGGPSDSLGGLVLTGDPTAAAGFSLGEAAGADGTVSISGSVSGLGVYGAVADGVSGAGSIAVTDGGHLVSILGTLANGLLLGVNSGGAGTMSVDSGAQVYVVGHSLIGDAGAGSLSITGGSSFTGVASYNPSLAAPFQSYGHNAAMALGLAATGAGDVLISDPSTFVSLTGGLVVGDSGRGSLGVTNAAVLLVDGGLGIGTRPSVIVGNAAGSVGTLSLSGQAQMLTDEGVDVGGGGHGELDVSNATLTIDATLASIGPDALGIGGNGVVNVAGGVIVDQRGAGMSVGGTLMITQVGSQGGTVLTGGGFDGIGLSMGFSNIPSLISVSGPASGLGVYGTTEVYGTLSVGDGAAFVSGSGADSLAVFIESGTMSLTDGAVASMLGQTSVGYFYTAGTLSVTGGSGFNAQAAGTLVSDTALVLVANASVLVSDPGSYMNLSGGILIGNEVLGDRSGPVSMTVSNGALVAVTAVNASDAAVSIGNDSVGDSLSVDGAGSRLIDTGLFEVGGSAAEGFATVTIASGGSVTVAELLGQAGPAAMIGNPGAIAGAGSSVTVTGQGSGWTVGGGLLVGGNATGTATLDVLDGGRVTAGQVTINDIYTGIIAVDGAGSVLNATTLVVGGDTSNGTLVASSGGLIHSSSGIALGGTAIMDGGTLAAEATLSVSVLGEVLSTGGVSTVSAGAIVDLGNIVAGGGTLVFMGTITGSGLISIDGGVLALGSGEAAGVGIDYGTAGGGLVAQSAAEIAGTISGWAAGDAIDLQSVAATSESFASGTLSLFGASSQLVGTLHFAGSLSSSNFTLTALAGGGTEIGYHS